MARLGRLIPTTDAVLWTETLTCTACGEHREKPTVSSYSEAHELSSNLSGKPGKWLPVPVFYGLPPITRRIQPVPITRNTARKNKVVRSPSRYSSRCVR